MKINCFKILRCFVLLFVVVVLFSCSIETYSTKKMYADNEIAKYINDNQYDVEADSLGLVYIQIEDGNGRNPQKGDVVAFHYVGYFLDGTIFDSSYDRSYPLIVELGNGQIIKGLEYSLLKMNKGAKSKVLIPFYLAYDDNENAPVPAFSNLVFELELLDIDRKK